MEIYRGYSEATLDAQYNLRKSVPDSAEQIAHREAASARTRDTVPCRLDIAYGTGAAEKLDLFPPTSTGGGQAGGGQAGGGAPALIYIHGGYWHLSDKSDTSYIAPAITAAGIAFVSLNYALAPSAGIDQMVDQTRAAIAFVWRNASELGIDRDRICVSGHSAGGHLTAMAAAADWTAIGPGLPADLIKGACALSGLYDLEPVRLCYVNDVLALDEATARRNSPILREPAMNGPILLAVGADETDEFRRHQAAFADRWQALGADIRAMEIPGTHHYTIIHALADGHSVLCAAVIALVRATGKGEIR